MSEAAMLKGSLAAFTKKSREPFESLLKEFVEIQSVSSDPSKKPAILEGARLACDTIRRFGGEAAVIETDGNPIVHGKWGDDPSRPTVTVYNHLDVHPPRPT
jgi:acetylornithine deacetylase/succinyl-diaminopimelate desuccinylase-like protein